MVDEKIAISEYSLSASVACGKVRPFHPRSSLAYSRSFYASPPVLLRR